MEEHGHVRRRRANPQRKPRLPSLFLSLSLSISLLSPYHPSPLSWVRSLPSHLSQTEKRHPHSGYPRLRAQRASARDPTQNMGIGPPARRGIQVLLAGIGTIQQAVDGKAQYTSRSATERRRLSVGQCLRQGALINLFLSWSSDQADRNRHAHQTQTNFETINPE